MLKEWVQGDHITLVKNPNYWQSGRPYLDTIEYKILRDAQTMVAQFEAGIARHDPESTACATLRG